MTFISISLSDKIPRVQLYIIYIIIDSIPGAYSLVFLSEALVISFNALIFTVKNIHLFCNWICQQDEVRDSREILY